MLSQLQFLFCLTIFNHPNTLELTQVLRTGFLFSVQFLYRVYKAYTLTKQLLRRQYSFRQQWSENYFLILNKTENTIFSSYSECNFCDEEESVGLASSLVTVAISEACKLS